MSRVEIHEGKNLKTGDTSPDLRVKLLKDNEVARDLSDVDDVRLVLQEAESTETVVDDDSDGNVIIGGEEDDKANGYVEYEWAADDTEKARTLVGEFVVTYDGDEQEHYPNAGYFEVYIEEGLI